MLKSIFAAALLGASLVLGGPVNGTLAGRYALILFLSVLLLKSVLQAMWYFHLRREVACC